MLSWMSAIVIAAALIAGGGLYIRLRWRRSPQAYRAMVALAVCYFVAGSILGAWVLHFAAPSNSGQSTRAAPPSPVAFAPVLNPTPAALPSIIGSLGFGTVNYDPAHAALPDTKLTPGDVFQEAAKDDVCTPGWSREHRHVTDSMRSQVYTEYGRTEGPGCCEVDRLIPLELGGSNEIKNLWPQPDDVRPGWPEKDQLENELHTQVCSGKTSLTEAQKCIASNWVDCWKKYVLPGYGLAPKAAAPVVP
jgi:hypothetical protein